MTLPSLPELARYMEAEGLFSPRRGGVFPGLPYSRLDFLHSFNVRYTDAVAEVTQHQGLPCYRVVRLPLHQDPLRLQRLGTHWSSWEYGAFKFSDWPGLSTNSYFYRARFDLSSLDNFETLIQRVIFPQEKELLLRPGSKLWVYDTALVEIPVYPDYALGPAQAVGAYRSA
jgi:hypothetical protein